MKLSIAILFILMMDVLFFVASVSIANINPVDGPDFFTFSESWIADQDAGNYTQNEALGLPTASSAVNTDSGNFFTDTWKTLSDWVQGTSVGAFASQTVNGPVRILRAAGLPQEIAFALAAMWHILTVFLIVTWLRGGGET